MVICPDPFAAPDSQAKRVSKFGFSLIDVVEGVLFLALSVLLLSLTLPISLVLVCSCRLPLLWERSDLAPKPIIVFDEISSRDVAVTTRRTNIVDVALVFVYMRQTYQKYPLYELRRTS